EETMELLSSVRLGVNLGLLEDLNIGTVNELFLHTQPAHLQKLMGTSLDGEERNNARARYLRTRLRESGLRKSLRHWRAVLAPAIIESTFLFAPQSYNPAVSRNGRPRGTYFAIPTVPLAPMLWLAVAQDRHEIRSSVGPSADKTPTPDSGPSTL